MLVNGFAVGMWKIARSRGTAGLIIELFGPVRAHERDAVTREGERLLAFAAPDAPDHDIRFAPIA